ncbi:MAG: hypothetical protein ACFE96_08525 [Candidatus Hermodarchaeota archaeon]
MSCPNCGAKLELPSQRFCQDCGTNLANLPDSSRITQKPLISQETRDYQRLQQKRLKPSSSRPLSKTSLGLGIVSVIIAVTTFNFGSSFFIEPYLLPLSLREVLILIFGILNIIGLVFGIISKITNIQAKRIETINVAMKAGSILGFVGTILNTLLAIVAFAIIAGVLIL